MHPRALHLILVATALAGLALLSIPSPARSQEDTAHLVLRKKMAAKDRPSVYIVQKGDNLSTIIRRRLGKPASESVSVSRLVRKLNPHIRDVNRIYPGQKITLPRLAVESGKRHYVVRRGDSLSAILHEKLRIPAAEMAKWVGFLKKLNPGLGDPNRLYPGQTLILPDKGATPSVPDERVAGRVQADVVTMDSRVFRPAEKDLDIIAAVVKQSGGTLIRDGKYFIPLTDKEHLAVDCTDIPMAELADGSRIFLDFGHQIPADTAALVRSRWGNFTVITEGGNQDVFSVLAGIFGASRDYAFRRHEGYLDMGMAPALKLRVDWILARKSLDGRQENYLCGICRTSGRSEPIPYPVARFAEKKGFPIIEIDEEIRALRVRQAFESAPDIPALHTGGNQALVGSLLDALGYTYTKQQPIPVSGAAHDGTSLVIRPDYSLKIGPRTLIIHTGDLPAAIQVSLSEKGMDLVQIADEDERKTVLEKVLKGLDIPFLPEIAKFTPPEDGGPPRWILALGVIRITTQKGVLFLVPSDADRELCAFIRERWNHPLVRF